MTAAYISSGADISACGRYRYLLWREWRRSGSLENWAMTDMVDGAGNRIGEPKSCLFVMLNPSTADASIDDPTIRRCVAFAKRWRYDRLEVVNLFAYRATNPKTLLTLGHKENPIGDRNSEVVSSAAFEAGLIVCAWGAHGGHMGHDETVRGWLGARKSFALGFTKAGQPRHPLYVPREADLVAMPA